ncbi:related to dithiol-disulfide isomerase involved in polyketide biosynthesis [Ramularia collo-cygni]|uniref:Related to dithiol-disulfide isomerase involved in polyketide biosynthesis n=1 Tax=Ramularia collo-cygni TaxID=112498 RepID=A0A2D3VJL7_9PEZI|nr:related to dithiol-disulfide isomerase involved in polyketide biosynthesis [Ramularia collo-cygni]CZT25757.1 related to dithiol-disulfide isomerase involved in polyketide biosynthesis [Ramularia collo-cygni]
MTHYDIKITSDTVCPWCYVGKNRLELAIKEHKANNPNDTFSTEFLAYYLNPEASKSVSKQGYYESKFGVERTKMMQKHMASIGQSVGIAFRYGGQTGNTRDSHRLIQLGKAKGGEAMQKAVVESLFNGYFENEEDITSKDMLLKRGVQAGLDEKEVKEWLDSDKGGEEVDKEVKEAKQRYISGVPHFVINGVAEIEGAEEPATFLRVFKAIKAQGLDAAGSKSSTGNAC